MKKAIALILSVIMICCFSVTAFAADSPSASEKINVTFRKATTLGIVYEADVEYTVNKDSTITFKAEEKYGKFDSWSVYKVEATGTTTGMVKLNVVNLAATKAVEAVEGVDYKIIKGDLKTNEITLELNASVIVCANYDGVITDPTVPGSADDSDTAPDTGDMAVAYAVIIMLAVAAFAFGVKKVYSK